MRFNRERIAFATGGAGIIGHPCAKNKPTSRALDITPHAEMNWKWTIDLNVKSVLQEKNLHDHARQKFLNMILKCTSIK